MDILRKPFCLTPLIALFAALAFSLSSATVEAQVNPSAYRRTQSFWVGAEYSNISASFPYQSNQRLAGVGAFADFKFKGYAGIEGDARFLRFGGFEGSTESNYLIGPKAYFLSRGKFRPYAKFLVGEGKIHYPFDIGDGSYFALAPGAGTGYMLNRRWMLRAEYEYQLWLNSPGFSNQPNHQLTPNGFHAGVAFRLFP